MSHFLTDYFQWLFVRRIEGNASTVELWRCEEPRGDRCLYASDPLQTVKVIRLLDRPMDQSQQISLVGPEPYLADHAKEGHIEPLTFLNHELARVLCNETGLDEYVGGRVGRAIYNATLQAFRASMGTEVLAMSAKDERQIADARHVWVLAMTREPTLTFRLVGSDQFFRNYVPLFLQGRVTPQRPTVFDFTGGDVMELSPEESQRSWKILSVFPRPVADVLSYLGAIGGCGDPFRFEAVKRLVSHAAQLGWPYRDQQDQLTSPRSPDPEPHTVSKVTIEPRDVTGDRLEIHKIKVP